MTSFSSSEEQQFRIFALGLDAYLYIAKFLFQQQIYCINLKGTVSASSLDSAGWRFVAVVGYLMLIFSCIPTFWQTKISICRSAHSLFVSLRCIHCALLCKSYVCWHSCRCFKTPLSQSGRALVSSDSQSSPTSHTSVSHTIAVKLLPQRVAGHHRSYSSPTEPDR